MRVGGYAILGRTLDKCRALIAGNIGEYHFDCPLDNMLFGFKGVKGDDFKAEVEKGASDEEMAKWLDTHGEKKTPDEVKDWSDEMEKANPSTTIRKSANGTSRKRKSSGSIRRRRRSSIGSRPTTRRAFADGWRRALNLATIRLRGVVTFA